MKTATYFLAALLLAVAGSGCDGQSVTPTQSNELVAQQPDRPSDQITANNNDDRPTTEVLASSEDFPEASSTMAYDRDAVPPSPASPFGTPGNLSPSWKLYYCTPYTFSCLNGTPSYCNYWCMWACQNVCGVSAATCASKQCK